MKKAKVVLTCILLSLASSIVPTFAQSPSEQPDGTIIGALLDVCDARITRARIKVQNANFKWEGKSNDAGEFTVSLPPGTYRIYADANGFRKFESASLNVKASTKEMVNLHLDVAVIIDTVKIREP